MDSINGIPLRWDAVEDNALLGGLLSNGTGQLGSVQGVAVNSGNYDFTGTSQVIWQGMRQGSPLDDNDPMCGAFVNDFHGTQQGEVFDYKKVVKFIKDFRGDHTAVFDWKKLTPAPVRESVINNDEYGFPFDTGRKEDRYYMVPYVYTDENGKAKTARITGKLNKRICYLEHDLNKQWAYSLTIDAGERIIEAKLYLYYKDTYGKRNDAADTIDPDDFRINDKYKAIVLVMEDLNDFVYLVRDLYEKRAFADIRVNISRKYVSKIFAANNAVQLKYLYNNIPNFVAEYISTTGAIPPDLLWQHMLTLTDYDDTGLLSVFKDASAALINVFKAIGSSPVLYKKIVSDQKFIRRIYYNLDGKSEVNGELASNRIIFSNFLAALCSANGYDGLTITDKTFQYGRQYKLDANVRGKGEGDDGFYLQQLKKIPLEGIDFTPFTEDIEEGAEGIFKPLDIIYILDNSIPGAMPVPLPAIVVKALSDEIEWQEIQHNIRLGFDVLALAIGTVVVLTTGNPIVFALALADIGLAVTDLSVQTFSEEIESVEGGRDFLAKWERVYFYGNLATAAPGIIASLFKLGAGVLKVAIAVNNFNVRNYITALFARIIIERNIARFTLNSLQAVSDVNKEFGASSMAAKLIDLQREGAAIFKGFVEGETGQQFLLFFQGKIVSFGDIRKVISDVSDLVKIKGASLIDKINKFLLFLRKEKTLVNTSAKIGDAATEQTIKWGTVKMQLHPRFGEMMKFLKERKVQLVEIEDVAAEVGYTETMIYDKFGTLLRVEKKLEWHPEMRFLDLEHEIDHVIQFEKNLEGKFCTELKIEVSPGRIKVPSNSDRKLGYTTKVQKALLEYDVRVKEFFRLKRRGVNGKILDEHIAGLENVMTEYTTELKKIRRSQSELSEFKNWKDSYFPEFKEVKITDIK
jgi:hypothetical protein